MEDNSTGIWVIKETKEGDLIFFYFFFKNR